MQNKRICLFLTYEGSLKKWDESGILDREVSLYLGLIKQGAKVAFLLMATRMIIIIERGYHRLKLSRPMQLLRSPKTVSWHFYNHGGCR